MDRVASVAAGEPPFLTLRRVSFRVEADPRVVHYDVVERTRRDASVIVAYFLAADGAPHVALRTVLRPPLVLGNGEAPGDAVACTPLWEVAAGLIDAGELPVEAAARELGEELGYSVSASRVFPLGGPLFGAAGVLAERLFFFAADVSNQPHAAPHGDGGPLEDFGDFATVSLDEALLACTEGIIQDLKTELILRRLKDALSTKDGHR